jgi:CubicO group peptidase (beta-lactamase class C family)
MQQVSLQSLDDRLQSAIEQQEAPGLILLVSYKGKILYHKAFGYAQLIPEKKELTLTTLFDVASLTKVLATTTSILLLLKSGEIALRDPVSKYFPNFNAPMKSRITICHLLTHSSGFPAYYRFYQDLSTEDEHRGGGFLCTQAAKREVIQKILEHDLVYQPGLDYKYSDLGFILLGALIERITSMDLSAFCQQQIWIPLGMKNTFFNDLTVTKTPSIMSLPNTETPRKFAATENCPWRNKVMCGEVHDENCYAMGGIAGHAGLFSTSKDIYTLITKLLQSYYGNDDWIPPYLMREFFTRQYSPEHSTWALGWDTPSPQGSTSGTLFSKESVGHTGFTGTSIWIDLKKNLVVILLSNRVHPSRSNERFARLRPEIHDKVQQIMMNDE